MAFKCERYDFLIWSRAKFETPGELEAVMAGLSGSPNMTQAEARHEHEKHARGLRERAANHPGAFVAFDPNDDEDGLLLCGDDPQELDREILETVL